MSWLALALAAAFALLGLACLLLVVLGLPGTWVLLALAIGFELVDSLWLPGAAAASFGWRLIAGCAALGLIGEGIEAVAGAAGTRLGGGTRRGMVGAFIGGIAGAILLTPLFPIPVIGTLLGAMLGAFLGAFVGEATGPEARSRQHNLRAAFGAAVGKLGGTLAKLAIGVVMWLLLVRAAFDL
jgi:uncharacterized protein YqgC (DUF456 family)